MLAFEGHAIVNMQILAASVNDVNVCLHGLGLLPLPRRGALSVSQSVADRNFPGCTCLWLQESGPDSQFW